ncbi:MAG TPA: DUF4113 domain-containing protein [Oculatellaceae cyanobacterium]
MSFGVGDIKFAYRIKIRFLRYNGGVLLTAVVEKMNVCRLAENKKIIVLVDANNFFVACERAFNPSLWNKPVVVLSNNDGNVIARSEEAKQLGIQMGEVFHQRRHWYEQHGVRYFSSNYSVYLAKSQQIIRILSRYARHLEYYSVDEAWLDLSDVGEVNVTQFCREIRQVIQKEARIPCSFGIGRNKTQAKLAAAFAKKQPKVHGVFNLINHPLYEAILSRVSIDELWGINRRLARRLHALGIRTAQELAHADLNCVLKKTNVNVGKILCELRHQTCFTLQKPSPPQMISVSLSFSYDTSSLQDVLEAAACYVARAAVRLRQNRMAARHVSVFLNTNRYAKNQVYSVEHGEVQLRSHTIYTPDFIAATQKIVRQCFNPEKRYHKVTVMLSDLKPLEGMQKSLWDTRDWDKMAILMGLVDVLNERYGEGSFRFPEEGERQRWKVRRQYVSGATVENMGLSEVDPGLVPICRIGTDALLVDGFGH